MFQAPLGKNKNPTANMMKGAQFPHMTFMREVLRKLERYYAFAAQGSITMTGQPANNEPMNIGGKTYTWQTTLTNADGNIAIGASLAISQQNLIDAINCTTTTGGPGTQYATAMTENPNVSANTAFVANVLVITAKTAGAAGNSLVFTETVTNMTMDGAGVLGGTRAGADETDADSYLYSAHMTNSNSNYADDQDKYFKNLNDADLRWGGAWINNEFLFTPEVIATTASRKISLPDHFGRRYKSIRAINPIIWTQKDQRATIASPFAVNGSNTLYKAIALDATRFAYLYGQNAGTTGTYLVVGTVAADGSLTLGTPVIVDTNQNIDYVDMCLVNTDKIVICFANAAATNFIATRTASISVNTITMNALVQVVATAGTVLNTIVKIGTDKALLAFHSGVNANYYVVTLTGTVPSYGAVTALAGTPLYTILVQNGTDKAQAFYQKNSNCYTVTVSISGTNVSFGVELVMMNGAAILNNRKYHDAVQVATDKFVWLGSAYDEANNGDRRNAAFITVSSTTSTVASVAKSGNWTADWLRIMPVTVGSDYYFLYRNGTSMIGKNFTVNTTTNTITFPYGNPENEQQNNDFSQGYGYFPSIWHSQVTNFPNIGGNCIPVQVGNHTVIMYLGLGSFFHYFTSNQVTADVYVNETLAQSLTFKYALLMEPKYLNVAVNDIQANIRIKNTFAQSIQMRVNHVWVDIE